MDAVAPAYDPYDGKRIGVLTGPLMESTAAFFFQDSETLSFNSYPDCATALLCQASLYRRPRDL